MKAPEGILDKIRMLPKLAELGSIFPATVRSGPCKEVVETASPSLARLPIIKCWPQDGGPYLTLAGVITRDPASGTRNVGMYRVQQMGKRHVAMHWQRHKTGAAHWREMAERGEKMPVCIVIGADPASMYSASARASSGLRRLPTVVISGSVARRPLR